MQSLHQRYCSQEEENKGERRETDEAVAPGLNTQLDYDNDSLYICLSPGEDHKRSSHCSSRSGSRKTRGYSVGLGRSQSGGLSGQDDAALPHSKTEDKILNVGELWEHYLLYILHGLILWDQTME